jgi:DNA polymerase (family 10)
MPLEAPAMSNTEIADRLAGLAQLLSMQNENPYKVKAYKRAAASIRNMSESVDELVRNKVDLTAYPGIGEAISNAIREIVLTGSLGKLEKLRSEISPELIGISAYPRLDPKQVLRIYKKLGISSTDALRESLENGAIARVLGPRMAQHVSQGLTETHAILLSRAHDLRLAMEEFLLGKAAARRVEAVGDYRRRVELIEQLDFIVETSNFAALVATIETYGGRTPLVKSTNSSATFTLSAGVSLRVDAAPTKNWGLSLVRCTGSKAHLRKLAGATGSLPALEAKGPFPTEAALYRKFGLSFIEPELREGYDEVERAAQGNLPVLVTVKDLCGELHAHSTSSDGADSIEQMAIAARDRGYEYLGITDHSQSLKIARGVSIDALRRQIRLIDNLNGQLNGIRILKAAEVDILANGALDYPDDLLRELDYTVCSIHSQFNLEKKQQTDRILRAMDNRYFNILGHATGRRLLKRPGYEIDMERIIAHAKQNGCFFEINSSPERLDLSAENARLANAAGIKIAVSTDAHSTRELGFVRNGIDQARRAGLEKTSILNCLPWPILAPLFKR